MARAQNPNIAILEIAVQALGPVCDDLVFLGGCATALLISDSAAPPVRATRDVDAIAEIVSVAEYHELGKRLVCQCDQFSQRIRATERHENQAH
jgi:hypothetical protein